MTTNSTKKHDAGALDELYTQAEGVDNEVFAEMRSNLLLIAGEHYSKLRSNFHKRIRDSKELTEQVKLRLTKNHIQNITKKYVNNIISMAPGVGFSPKTESELQDQKAAELHHSVWLDVKEKQVLDEKIDDWCDDFVGLGEVAVKIIWDVNEGPIKAYQQKTDEAGAPLFLDHEGNETTDGLVDPSTGQPTLQGARGTPVYTGGFVFETIQGFNLLRAPEARELKASPYLINRKMVQVEDLKAKFPDKADKIASSADDTMVVFDSTKNTYRKAAGEVMVRETYFRPCPQYPRGYFYISTKEGILAEGELPGGIFPIATQAFDKIQTTPRGRSAVKHMRPYQAEINRAASKIAEHQITLGDDKLLIQNGTTVTPGVALPGVRAINFTGMQPAILNGRDGSQYLAYMQAQIQELYDVMNVSEDAVEKDGQLDPYALLFRSASQKKKFQRYIKRFERFLVEVAKITIKLAKIHYPDDMFIAAAGKNEAINISEFRSMDDLCYQIKIEAQSDDIETKMGKQLVLNHALQYVGQKLDKEDIGKIMRAMPYGNFDHSMSDLTLDYDVSTNEILALDRGQLPQVHPYDNHEYALKRLGSRMRQADFNMLPPQVQQNYNQVKQTHEQMAMERVKALQDAENGFIPTGGYMVVVDLYVSDPNDPMKTRRARVPYDAIKWLIERLEAQGKSLDQLEQVNQGMLAEMSGHMGQPQRGGAPNGMGAPQMRVPGAGMPGGEMRHDVRPRFGLA